MIVFFMEAIKMTHSSWQFSIINNRKIVITVICMLPVQITFMRNTGHLQSNKVTFSNFKILSMLPGKLLFDTKNLTSFRKPSA